LIASKSHRAAEKAALAADEAAEEAKKSNQIILYLRLAPHFKKIDKLIDHIKNDNKECNIKKSDITSIEESITVIKDFFPKNKISATITELLKGITVVESKEIQGISFQKLNFSGENFKQIVENINNFEDTVLNVK